MMLIQDADEVVVSLSRGRPLDADVGALVRRLAANHHGAVSHRTLRRAGVSPGALERRVRSGIVRRAARGVYVVEDCSDTWTGLAVRQLRWSHAVACDRTAAALWSLDAFDRPGPTLLTQPQLLIHADDGGAPAGVRRTQCLDVDDVSTCMGLRVTSVVRTLADLACHCEPEEVERALEAALRRRLTSVPSLEVWLDAPARPASQGTAVLRRVLDLRGRDVEPTGSDPETRLVQLLRREGLPPGVRQHEIWVDERFVARPDLFYPEARLAVEVDGSETHVGPDALQSDLDRQNRMTLAGIAVLRFTYFDVTRRPRTVARRLALALESRSFAVAGDRP